MIEPGQGPLQLGELALAFILSALIGLEREIRQKSAGVRTYALVGVSAALFMLVSKHGFDDVLASSRVVLDPSRVAAQIVSGIGFIGGGVIFMRRDVVRGLTTAASVWLTAAIGMACGAGLLLLALVTVAGHFIIMLGFPPLVRRLRRSRRSSHDILLDYQDGRGLLRDILVTATSLRFAIEQVRLSGEDHGEDEAETRPSARGIIGLRLRVRGKRPVSHLVARLAAIEGVVTVSSGDDSEID
ncbi:MgtC/SapB family protein [Acetobacteraceae bacterium KSS8]|uniref:Protein MgtC n=1 Tax=Endosaccharibacter trunci TaxID=2812733 RepID=A0ABT1W332_9PROT|nr:MgtC/SapB family protein [Acetobacteraceae bacterium KSS8]